MKKLTEGEEMFCRAFLDTRNAREAAARAGYRSPLKQGVKLMAGEEVAKELDRLLHREPCTDEVTQGLRRVAFGSVADGVRLALSAGEVTAGELENMDLFNLSELKFSKGGVVEVKFYDRMEALDRLYRVAQEQKQNGDPFYHAMELGARALAANGEEEV